MGYDSCNKSLYNNDNLPAGFNDHSNDRRYNSFMKHEELRTKVEVQTDIDGYTARIANYELEVRQHEIKGNDEKADLCYQGIDYCYDQINKLNQEKTK